MSGWRKRQIEDLKMEKVIKSGLVAVLISPDFGAGWSGLVLALAISSGPNKT